MHYSCPFFPFTFAISRKQSSYGLLSYPLHKSTQQQHQTFILSLSIDQHNNIIKVLFQASTVPLITNYIFTSNDKAEEGWRNAISAERPSSPAPRHLPSSSHTKDHANTVPKFRSAISTPRSSAGTKIEHEMVRKMTEDREKTTKLGLLLHTQGRIRQGQHY